MQPKRAAPVGSGSTTLLKGGINVANLLQILKSATSFSILINKRQDEEVKRKHWGSVNNNLSLDIYVQVPAT